MYPAGWIGESTARPLNRVTVLGSPAVLESFRPVALRHNLSDVLPLYVIQYYELKTQIQAENYHIG